LRTADEAHQIATHMVTALAMGDGPFAFDPERVRRTRQLLLSARPDSEMATQIRSISVFLRSATRILSYDKAAAIAIADLLLGTVDERLGHMKGPVILDALRKIAKRGSMSGAIVDLLMKTGALGTSPTDKREPLQKRVDKMLKRHAKPFDWQGSRAHRYFTSKYSQRWS
jgi:hypothetical protein